MISNARTLFIALLVHMVHYFQPPLERPREHQPDNLTSSTRASPLLRILILFARSLTASINLPTTACFREHRTAIQAQKICGFRRILLSFFRMNGETFLRIPYSVVFETRSAHHYRGAIHRWCPPSKRGHRDCSSHRGISLVSLVTEVIASMMLRHLMPVRENHVCKRQAGPRLCRHWIDQIFATRQLLETYHINHTVPYFRFLSMNGKSQAEANR